MAFEIVDQKVAPLFTPFKLAGKELTNRMVYPPLTRMRGTTESVPTPLMAEYYGQRATAGSLFIAEGTYISPDCNGYWCAPGVYNDAQVEAWKPVTKAVKDKGAVFFCQLMHCGRAAHPALQGGKPPRSSSAVAIGPAFQVFLPDWSAANYVVPEALDKAGIQEVIGQYVASARNAIAAGFDGVELHGASGYLIDQFTKDGVNKRTDEYGGSIENRARFVLELVAAVVDAVGADRVGIRFSPFANFIDAVDSTPYATFTYVVEQLNKFKLAYLHMVEGRASGDETPGSLAPFRTVFQGPFIASGGYNAHTGAEAVASGHTDLVAYGRWWLANPDLPKRFALGAPLNKYDRNTFYGGGAPGYTDYPLLEDAATATKAA